MKGQSNKSQETFGVVAVALLLILTAWGNALAMMIVCAIATLAGSFMFRKQLANIAVVAVVACIVAIAAVLLMGST
jgi:hypothetical protein